jgi:hypothetical protein
MTEMRAKRTGPIVPGSAAKLIGAPTSACGEASDRVIREGWRLDCRVRPLKH